MAVVRDTSASRRATRRSAAPGRAAEPAVNDLHFAVCIGIDRYPGFPGLDLRSASQDARSFRDWLIAPDGGRLPPDNVALVTAAIDEQWPTFLDARPHIREINRALPLFNIQIRDRVRARPADWARTRVYLYAAGHGVGPPRGECGVLMADSDPDLLGNYVDVSKYRDWYLACGLVHEVAIFADCCREIVKGVPPANEVPFTSCSLDGPSGTAAFTAYATRLGERAWEPEAGERDRARGYFTRALLEGLQGGAADGAGVVTSPALGEFIGMALADLTRDAPFAQEADPHHRPGSALLFGGDRSRLLRRATVRFGPRFADAVLVRSGRGVVHGPWQPSDGDWELDLPNGFYEVVPSNGAPGDRRTWLFKVVGTNVEVTVA